jgi:hypothetical protein
MLRALADARPRLLYGVGADGPLPSDDTNSTPPLFGDVGAMLLRENRMAVEAGTTATATESARTFVRT